MNNKIIVLAIMLLLPLCLAASTLDTVKVFTNPARVVIAEDSAGVMMSVVGNDSDDKQYNYVYRNDHLSDERVVTTQSGGSDIRFKLPFQREDTTQYRTDEYRRHIDLLLGGLYFGWGGLHVSGGDVAMDEYNKGMMHWGVMYALGVRYQPLRRHYITAGIGFEGQTYKMKGGMQLVADDEHHVTVRPFADGAMSCKSFLNISTLQLPVIYSLPLVVKDLRFSAGPIVDFNIKANIFNSYKTIDSNGHKQTITDEFGKLGIRQVTVDLFGALTYDGIGAFVRYRPMSVFKTDCGPKFNSWSAGLIIAF